MKAFFKKVWAWIVAHKVVSIVIASVLAVGIALAIILPIALHQHDYEENWSQGYISHWHNATCHENEKKDIEKHIFEKIDVKPAKCTEDGSYREKCTVCGFITATKTVDATGHTSDNGVVTKAPTCTEEGVKTYTCTVEGCGTVTKTEAIAKLPHTYTENAACDTKCNVCGATREVETAHTWNAGEVTKAPTCTAEGVKTFTCTLCADTNTVPVEMIAHTWDEGEVTKAPTCTAEGVKTFTCACGTTNTEPVEKTAHVYDNDCQDTICANCDATREAVSHVYDNCDDTTCANCAVTREPVAHVYDNCDDTTCANCAVTREPVAHVYDNCDDTTCANCDVTREAVSHVYDNCDDTTCANCDVTREAVAHVYDNCDDTTCANCDVTREAVSHVYDNCEDTICANCDATREAVSHVYDNCDDTTCANCDATRTAQEHEFTEATQNAPVYKEDGVYNVKKCANCDKTTEVKDDNFIVATTQEAAQIALDGDINGKTLVLYGEVNFGELIIRATSDEVRSFENVTITCVNDATVANIVFNQYGAEGAKAFVEIKNLTLNKIDFVNNEKSAMMLWNADSNVAAVSIDGLNVTECSFKGENIAQGNNTVYFISVVGSKTVTVGETEYTTTIKNVVIDKCYVEGTSNNAINFQNAYEDEECEILQSAVKLENLTVTNCEFKNIKDQIVTINMIGNVGTVVVEGNKADSFGDRFSRIKGVEGTVIFKNNTITNWINNPNDAAIIKASNTTATYTIEGNTLDGVALTETQVDVPVPAPAPEQGGENE